MRRLRLRGPLTYLQLLVVENDAMIEAYRSSMISQLRIKLREAADLPTDELLALCEFTNEDDAT